MPRLLGVDGRQVHPPVGDRVGDTALVVHLVAGLGDADAGWRGPPDDSLPSCSGRLC